MPIILAPLNKTLKVIKIVANEELKKRLESLGIILSENLTVLNNSGGSVICQIKSGKIALDGNLSTKIFVTEN